MDGYLSYSQNRANNFDPPPILIAADTAAATARARATVASAGFRIAAAVGIEDIGGRLERQAAASALWLELDADFGSSVDELLDRIATDLSEERYSAVLAVPASELDRLGSFAFEPNIHVILDAAEDERIAALAVAVSEVRKPERLSDVGADKNAARLRQLSDEVSRIAATLARLSTRPAATPVPSRSSMPVNCRRFPLKPSGRSSGRSGCAAAISPKSCSADPA